MEKTRLGCAGGFQDDVRTKGSKKLDLINAAAKLKGVLRIPPGNRLEALQGDLAGYQFIPDQ